MDDQPFYGSWFLRFDRFGDTHMVAAQGKGQSCGLASIKMIYFKINKLRPGKSAFDTEAHLEDVYKQKAAETAHDFELNGASPYVMVDVLNELGIGRWALDVPNLNDVGDHIAKYVGVDQMGLGVGNLFLRNYPVILACYWQTQGGHAIVVDTVTNVPVMGKYASICDPWDANVHFERIQSGRPFTYSPTAVSGVNVWGETRADKDGIGGHGTVKAVIYCQTAPT